MKHKITHADITFSENGTPHATEFNDTYYNVKDGLAETKFVYLNANNVSQRFKDNEEIHIGETGFGTGLNFLATWLAWKVSGCSAPLTFTSCEKFPLTVEDFKNAQGRWDELSDLSAQLANAYPKILKGETISFENGLITLNVGIGDVLDVFSKVKQPITTWYLDGFTPSRNPDMWTEALFTLMYSLSNKSTTGATFTAVGDVRRGLRNAGFNVKRIKGYGYKYHMMTFNNCTIDTKKPA